MELYYHLDKQCRCDAQGVKKNERPLLHYKEKPVWILHLLTGTTQTHADLSSISAFRAAIDTDFSRTTDVLCRTTDLNIDHSRAAQGILSIPVNANTTAFASAVNGQTERTAYFELTGLNSSGDVTLYVRFEIRLAGILDPDGGTEPADVLPDYIPGTTFAAWLRAADEYQFSADNVSWHALQQSGDLYMHRRNSQMAGAWGASITLPCGADGQLTGASTSVSALVSNKIQVTSAAIPVQLKTNLGNIYPVEKGTLTSDTSYWYIDPTNYLTYDGVSTFTGPWTIYFAGGLPEVQTIIALTGTSITPQEHQTFKHTLAAGDTFTIVTSALTSTMCLTFELWLDMPSTAVAFTLPTMTWLEGSAPSMTAASTRYVITVRWNGTKLLANLAYTESLA